MEQSKQITNLRGILAIAVGGWVLLSLFARSYMSTYNTPLGQLALGLIVVGFILTVLWFVRLARPVMGARFLEDVDEGDTRAAGTSPASRRASTATGRSL